MSPTFSISRLGKLITKQFFENLRLYTFSVLALFGLLSLAFAFWFSASEPRFLEEGTYVIMIFGLFITGSVFASMAFNMLGNKDKGIYWLSVPATHLEKLICTIFYSTIVFTLVYLLCFYTVKTIVISLLTEYIKTHPGSKYYELTDFENGFGGVIKYFIYGYFAVQSLHLLGSVYFKRYSFIITTVVGAVLAFTFAYYLNKLQYSLHGTWDITSLKIRDTGINDSYRLYSVSPTVNNIIKYMFQFAWAPLFWVVAWFRLKEKEI
jgi:hypothetical protein